MRSGFDGTLPVDGASGTFEWQGYIPHEMKPSLFNPEEGFIVAANHKMVPDDAPYPLGRDQLAPFRANRIASLLTSRAVSAMPDFQRMQADRYDPSSEQLLKILVALNPDTDMARTVQQLLRSWDGHMAESAGAAIYQAFYLKLLENTFKDELGEELYAEFLDFVEFGYSGGIYSIIDDPASAWWDDSSTAPVEDRTAMFQRSLEDAIALLESQQGASPGKWNWGTLHGIVFEHPLGRDKRFGWLFNRGPIPFGGSTFTIANAVVDLTHPFQTPAGTSFRLVVDLGNLGSATTIVPTGVSGHPLSPHYFDQSSNWQTGQNQGLLFERAQIEGELEGRLLVSP
jgi:penicillin amidase